MHVFLSPHLDDAALSCGGCIHQLRQAGERVHVITSMAGDAPATLPDTPLIRDLHMRWSAGDNPFEVRRAEDRDALHYLDVTYEQLTLMDCIYRLNSVGEPMYPTRDELFGEINPDDPVLRMMPPLPVETRCLYVPAAVGGHVDHQIVRLWGLSYRRRNPQIAVKFYVDYPYSRTPLNVVRAETYFAEHDLALAREIVDLTDADVSAKIQSIRLYASQITTFWNSDLDLTDGVRSDLVATGDGVPAECLWTIVSA